MKFHPETYLQRKPRYLINIFKFLFIPSSAWKSWLPRMADTLPTLFFKVCSSGLVRSAWYLLRSPTALSVSASQKTKLVFALQQQKKKAGSQQLEKVFLS